jgi:hypothetical protein
MLVLSWRGADEARILRGQQGALLARSDGVSLWSLPPPPPTDIPPPTPDGESDLLYLDPAPIGIDAEYAWTRPGGSGLNVVVTDIEYAWRTSH